MLTLNRRTGETIYLGDDTCITVYDRLRYHVMLGVLAPANACLQFGESHVRPAILPDGERFYLLTMLGQDLFWIDDIKVRIRFNPTYLGSVSLRMRQVKVDIDAPQSVDIYREEIYLRRLREAGRRLPVMSFSAWLHRANVSVSSRAAA